MTTFVDPEDEIHKLRRNLFDAIDEIEQAFGYVESELKSVDGLPRELGEQIKEMYKEKYMNWYMEIKERSLVLCKEVENFNDSVLFPIEEMSLEYMNL